MWVIVPLRMELMAEGLGKRPAFLMQESPWSPSLSTILPQLDSVLSKILVLVHRAIAIWSSLELSSFPTLASGKASNKGQCGCLVQRVANIFPKG